MGPADYYVRNLGLILSLEASSAAQQQQWQTWQILTEMKPSYSLLHLAAAAKSEPVVVSLLPLKCSRK